MTTPAGTYPDSSLSPETGLLDRRLGPSVLLVPEDAGIARVKAGPVVWWSELRRERRVGPGVLEQFVRLTDGPDADVAAYVRRWGPLMFCDEHHLPVEHQRGCRPFGWNEPRLKRRLPRAADAFDPLPLWRQVAGQAGALLRIGDRLRSGRVGQPDDWRLVYARSRRPLITSDVSYERTVLARVMNQWLSIGDVRPLWRWRRAAEFVIQAPGLFGTLALQLVAVLSAIEGLSLCSGCGSPYTPSRRPTSGRRHYCPPCRRSGVPLRDAQRERRARVREATVSSGRTS